MIGDAVLLPIINYKIFKLFLNYIGLQAIKKYQRKAVIWIFVAAVISVVSNIFTHLAWVNDQLTDFVGFKKGEFSLIGYWHLAYSILQVLLLFIFPFFWYVAIKDKNHPAINYSHILWKYILLFSTLSIFDMLNKYFFVYHGRSLLYAMLVDKFAFTTVISSLIFLFIMNNLERGNKAFPQ